MDLLKSSLPILRQLGRQTAARDAMAELPSGNLGAMIKIWVYLEARQLASSAVVNLDEMVQYDWYVSPLPDVLLANKPPLRSTPHRFSPNI
ncbi:hypothetical protein FRC08_011084 [Ceratobasidium sp. 394]|nr:hypothetical protein FRC08_011084 [Ceratobasidium sp. 394]